MMDQLKQIKIVVYEQEIQQQETKLRYLSQQIQASFYTQFLDTSIHTVNGMWMPQERLYVCCLNIIGML